MVGQSVWAAAEQEPYSILRSPKDGSHPLACQLAREGEAFSLRIHIEREFLFMHIYRKFLAVYRARERERGTRNASPGTLQKRDLRSVKAAIWSLIQEDTRFELCEGYNMVSYKNKTDR